VEGDGFELSVPRVRGDLSRPGLSAGIVLIEDKASGTQLIQELVADGCHGVTRYQPTTDKIMRLHAQTGTIETALSASRRPHPGLPNTSMR
jgi:hypothetical protein